ncbi:MAG: hypothetical protein IKP20_03800 [Candidatus Methanomethylophilaceae archaeon]|nr:hypothetical protein [Candidatus Methanomethylophilaceae archaeon]
MPDIQNAAHQIFFNLTLTVSPTSKPCSLVTPAGIVITTEAAPLTFTWASNSAVDSFSVSFLAPSSPSMNSLVQAIVAHHRTSSTRFLAFMLALSRASMAISISEASIPRAPCSSRDSSAFREVP